MKLRFTSLLIFLLASKALAQIPTMEELIEGYGPCWIRSNFEYSEAILDKQEGVTNKGLIQLLAREKGCIETYKIYVSFLVSGLYMHERTNTAGKFPILSRLPPSHTSGKTGNEIVLNDLLISGTATLPWVTFFIEGQMTDVEYPGQREMQLRKYWLNIGDLNQLPFYLTFGRKTVPFGDFRSYAPFTHNHSPHYFWAQSLDPILSLGFYQNGINVVGTLIANGRGRRVLNTPKDSGYENFALKASKEWCIGEDFSATVGGGYLRGSIYDSSVAHHPPADGSNDKRMSPIWNVNAALTYQNIDIAGEFSKTFKKWPAVNHTVHAWSLQGRYRDSICCMPTIYSLMFSRGVQGAAGTEWERMNQLVAGFELKPHENIRFGIEYLFNLGFVPLILPLQTGDRDVKSHTVIIGAEFIF